MITSLLALDGRLLCSAVSHQVFVVLCATTITGIDITGIDIFRCGRALGGLAAVSPMEERVLFRRGVAHRRALRPGACLAVTDADTIQPMVNRPEVERA